jgi:hypothetical protein
MPDLELAVAETLAYADVFDYPLTANETHRYLIGLGAPLAAVRLVLEAASAPDGWAEARDGYYTLAGRGALVQTRLARQELALALWPLALSYGHRIASLPFVRMVAVTGALAVDNVMAGADIDYLIVTRPGRLWLCRAMILLLARGARRRGVTLCPNYLVSHTREGLVFPEQNLYAAHEVAHMVPLSGPDVYDELRRLNRWVLAFLPNASGLPPANSSAGSDTERSRLKVLFERLLALPPTDWVERWEMQRKILKLTAKHEAHAEASFSRDRCKGHFDRHEEETLTAFRSRLAQWRGCLPDIPASQVASREQRLVSRNL